MKVLFVIGVFVMLSSSCYTQDTTGRKLLTPESAILSITTMKNGKYVFSYENSMENKNDLREIVFADRKKAQQFVSAIGATIKSKDGSARLYNYKDYSIRLLSEMGNVFMIVKKTGLSQSTLRISRETYNPIKNSMFIK